MKPLLLIIDDDVEYIKALSRSLIDSYDILHATSREMAIERIEEKLPDIVLLDLRLREDDLEYRDAISLLKEIKDNYPNLPVIIITAYGDIQSAVTCMKLGATDFIQKQSGISEIKFRLSKELNQSQIKRKAEQLEEEIQNIEPYEIIGESPKILEIKKQIEIVSADGYITVLITGETGTGKELVARSIHRKGWRSKGPFIPVDLTATALVESDLFGHEKGAFTDAKRRHMGFIERAHTGVLFLDEIGNLPVEIQLKLLRFLESREFYRVGGEKPVEVDVQVVTATNQDLKKLVEENKFREDLYYRIKVFEIHLPPLRERKEDIKLLVSHFINTLRISRRVKKVRGVSAEVMEILERYHWPGNIRELKNVIESACIWAELREHEIIEPEDIPQNIIDYSPDGGRDSLKIDEILARTELLHIEKALTQSAGNKKLAAKLLGYRNRITLYRRIERILKRYPHLLREFPDIKKFISGIERWRRFI